MTVQSGLSSPETAARLLRALRTPAWLLVGLSALAVTLWSRWDWLVAAGLASLVLAVLPCAVMCALGVCMHRNMPHAKAPSCQAPCERTDAAGERK
ncbi:hypothetical protein [Mesorhizobium denitrificans]|uniref:Uncharacterized protein n=1 Tax=Mesorhizobium denitrificans TaxID=2294114 RepID=A0A371X479_9HYPH|nr:hypothetical protein [Mesorhizobium denitrificans]RFC63824.1 hypothetical protein DY251_20620 [Mesorhizobium denitrificans]